MDDRELVKIKMAVRELARAIESGQRVNLAEHIGNILGDSIEKEENYGGASEPSFRCDCDKCRAIREGDNNGDDGVN